jgi:uncharacterized protein (TIGR02453 family)
VPFNKKNATMKYFKQEALSFLKELPKNNNKEWFNSNKELYKKEVEAPFKLFISDLITELQSYIPNINVEAKDCIFRIYKDVRFSKDKTPYKNHISAMISKGGRKDKTTPGTYIQISAEDIRLYSGVFELTTKQKEQIRVSIHENMDEFNAIINNSSFVKTFGEVRGEKYKKVPAEYIKSVKIQPLLLNKSLYFYKKYEPELILNSELSNTLIKDYSLTTEINEFFRKVLE